MSPNFTLCQSSVCQTGGHAQPVVEDVRMAVGLAQELDHFEGCIEVAPHLDNGFIEQVSLQFFISLDRGQNQQRLGAGAFCQIVQILLGKCLRFHAMCHSGIDEVPAKDLQRFCHCSSGSELAPASPCLDSRPVRRDRSRRPVTWRFRLSVQQGFARSLIKCALFSGCCCRVVETCDKSRLSAVILLGEISPEADLLL